MWCWYMTPTGQLDRNTAAASPALGVALPRGCLPAPPDSVAVPPGNREAIRRLGLFHVAVRPEPAAPQYLIRPSIDPLSEKNRELTEQEIQAVLTRLGIDQDKPLILQVSRFDSFKDPVG